MLARFRSHFRQQFVGYLALFVALSGTAFASGYLISKNRQLGPHTVSGSRPPHGAHANLIKNSIGGADIRSNSLGTRRIANGSLRESDLAPSAISPIAYGAAWQDYGTDICSSPTNCPLRYRKNVTSVTDVTEAKGSFCRADPSDPEYPYPTCALYCVHVRHATPATHPIIAGVNGEQFPSTSVRAGGLVVHVAGCPADSYWIETYVQDRVREKNGGFWFAVL